MTTVVNLRTCGTAEDIVRIHRPSRWGNPFRLTKPDLPGERERILALFRTYAIERLAREPRWLEPLRGKRLACWCAPRPCHGDVLVELLDRYESATNPGPVLTAYAEDYRRLMGDDT